MEKHIFTKEADVERKRKKKKSIDRFMCSPLIRLLKQSWSRVTDAACTKEKHKWHKQFTASINSLMCEEAARPEKNADTISRLIHQWLYFQLQSVKNIPPFRPWQIVSAVNSVIWREKLYSFPPYFHILVKLMTCLWSGGIAKLCICSFHSNH